MKLRRSLRVAFAATAGAGVLVLGTTSAAARPEGAKAPSADTAVSGNIVLAHWASSPVETALLKQVVQSFERKYPRIHVTRRALDPYPDSMLAQFAARKPPDVFYVDSNVAPDWIKQGVLQDLTPYIKQYKFRTKPFYPRLLGGLPVGREDLRVPEGLVAARDADEHGDVPAGRRPGSADVGAAHDALRSGWRRR